MKIKRSGSFGSSMNGMMEMLRDSSKSSSSRRNSFGSGSKQQPIGLSIELSLKDFKKFMSHILSKEVDYATLKPLYECLDQENFYDMLEVMEIGLHSILKSNPFLNAPTVGGLHSFLGLIYLEQDNNTAAVDSFLRAIWFQSRNADDTLAIAQANHRLGLAYGRKRDYQQAMDLIDKAIAVYDTSSEQYVLAKEDRHAVQEAQQLDLLSKNKKHIVRPDMEATLSEHRRMNRRRIDRTKTTPGHEAVRNRTSKSPMRRRMSAGGSNVFGGIQRSATDPKLQRRGSMF